MPGCTLTAKDHIEEFRRIVNKASWDDRFASRRDEKKVIPITPWQEKFKKRDDIEEVPF